MPSSPRLRSRPPRRAGYPPKPMSCPLCGSGFLREFTTDLPGVAGSSGRTLGRRIRERLFGRRQRGGLVEYGFDERVFRQVFVVLRYDRFGFLQSRKPPLNFKIFISGDALDNSAFFNKQLELARLI